MWMHPEWRGLKVRVAFSLGAWLVATCHAAASDADELAARVDRQLEQRFEAEQITPAPPADDAEFLRRVHLDLIGLPPAPDTVRQFLADADPGKRTALIDALLADPRHADHFATVWRSMLLPEADSDPMIRFFQPGLEAWLRQRRGEQAGIDTVVRELLSVPIAAPNQTPQLVLRDLKAPNPLAFIAAKGGDPAAIAASAARLFLGIRLECAQCHDHPFESWSQTQFWKQAAFFAGIERRGRGPFAPLVDATQRREIALNGSDEKVAAAYLDGGQPPIAGDSSPRAALADWITSADNPWFSRAIVNRIWAQLLGAGFVEPVDDLGQNNPPSHPELLDELASALAASKFDLTFLQAAICRTKAYQRSSRETHTSQNEPQRFARMAIKPMTGEQLFAVLSQAIRYEARTIRLGAGRDEDPVRRRLLNQFATSDVYSDPETSVSQALTLMNGRLVNDAAAPDSAISVHIRGQTSTEAQIEQLYLLALARPPEPGAMREFAAHVDGGDESARANRLGDVLWVLLNSAEFRWNH
jgi:hypothetical protein